MGSTSRIISEFKGLSKKLNSGCEVIDDICKDFEKEIDGFDEYWKGYSAEMFQFTMINKICILRGLMHKMAEVADLNEEVMNLFSMEMEKRIEERKQKALENNDLVEYGRLLLDDALDNEF